MRRLLASSALALATLALVGCPETNFPDEGSGQPSDRARGKAPPGSIGACRLRDSRRPPIVNEQLWNNLRDCNKRTPRRYLRLGYSSKNVPRTDEESKRLDFVANELRTCQKEADPNTRMLLMTRAVKQSAKDDEKLRRRIDKMDSRTFACDYAYLLNTTKTEYAKVQSDTCPAYAFDPKLRRDQCLFDLNVDEARWLTSAWACLAFTETAGEGESCYRMCAFDDYCTSQVGCAQPDFDLVLCALGVCMPEKVAGVQ